MMHFVVPFRPEGNIDMDGKTLITDKLAKECAKGYYSDKDIAISAAKQLATKNPMVQFVVMSPTAIYETTEPKVIRKVLTEAGEILIEKDGEQA